jgi:hypothetical protein
MGGGPPGSLGGRYQVWLDADPGAFRRNQGCKVRFLQKAYGIFGIFGSVDTEDLIFCKHDGNFFSIRNFSGYSLCPFIWIMDLIEYNQSKRG